MLVPELPFLLKDYELLLFPSTICVDAPVDIDLVRPGATSAARGGGCGGVDVGNDAIVNEILQCSDGDAEDDRRNDPHGIDRDAQNLSVSGVRSDSVTRQDLHGSDHSGLFELRRNPGDRVKTVSYALL